MCQRQWKEYHNQETGVEVWEKLDDVVGLSCSFSCLNQGQCCSHFVSLPLLSSSPRSSHLLLSLPSIRSSFLSSFTVNASCALCRLSHVTFGLCAVQTACGQWVGGGRGYEEAVMMSKALPFLYPLCIRLNYAEQGIPCNC